MINLFLLKICVISITNMQVRIGVLRRLLWIELFFVAWPVLPFQYWEFRPAEVLFVRIRLCGNRLYIL